MFDPHNLINIKIISKFWATTSTVRSWGILLSKFGEFVQGYNEWVAYVLIYGNIDKMCN